MYDDFFNETCKRSVGILEAVDSEATLEIYLKRVATTAIINVLKDSGRLRRSRTGYMSTKEISYDNPKNDVDYSNVVINYSNITIPETPEDIVIQRDFLPICYRHG